MTPGEPMDGLRWLTNVLEVVAQFASPSGLFCGIADDADANPPYELRQSVLQALLDGMADCATLIRAGKTSADRARTEAPHAQIPVEVPLRS
jgi:hypothetical protein